MHFKTKFNKYLHTPGYILNQLRKKKPQTLIQSDLQVNYQNRFAIVHINKNAFLKSCLLVTLVVHYNTYMNGSVKRARRNHPII